MPAQVWLSPANLLTPGSAQAKRCLQLLSEPERERLARYRTASQKHAFLSSRALLRNVLSTCCNTPPAELDFTANAAGKPRLTLDQAPHFNLSHSGQWMALAVDWHAPVGIDIEHPQKQRNLLAIARHYYHAREAQRLAKLDEPTQSREFYRLWTLKEAFFKARGTGISEGLNRICINPEGASPIAYFDLPESGLPRPEHLFYRFEPAGISGVHLAIARTLPPCTPEVTLFLQDHLIV
ncbi:4'-phosphopantetheinyl transferase family protein [Gilvimarinus agarilyticus]|uniref:4'-phosphopantetheinyl transferase family protein n=1 Tax=Gilvimarinus agarilyticus TaxID=679259 RepID=UPI00069756B3|nr:4'-phosphopantetheinyl transferase superfamily protein [Gilvimarinus agarilyticus]